MEHLDRPSVAAASVALSQLRQSIHSLMDADQVLPADGSSLLAALERARAGLTGKSPAVARAEIAAFIGRVEALIEAGALEIGDGRRPLETARVLGKEIDHVSTI